MSEGVNHIHLLTEEQVDRQVNKFGAGYPRMLCALALVRFFCISTRKETSPGRHAQDASCTV